MCWTLVLYNPVDDHRNLSKTSNFQECVRAKLQSRKTRLTRCRMLQFIIRSRRHSIYSGPLSWITIYSGPIVTISDIINLNFSSLFCVVCVLSLVLSLLRRPLLLPPPPKRSEPAVNPNKLPDFKKKEPSPVPAPVEAKKEPVVAPVEEPVAKSLPEPVKVERPLEDVEMSSSV